MKVLFLARDLPDPPNNGYKKRNFYLIKALESKGIEVKLFVPSEKPGTKIKALFLSLFSTLPFSVKIRTSLKSKEDLEKLLKENPIDIIICDAVQRALNIPDDINAVKILYEHNIESVIVKRYAEKEKNIFKKLFALQEYMKLSNFEKKVWAKFDYCIACSDVDKKNIETIAGKDKVITVDNGVDLQYFNPGSYQLEPDTLVYTGQIGWYPNEDALIYFVEEIMPAIKKSIPSLKLWIVGGKPSDRIKFLANNDSNITVTGFVDDVREYMARAFVYIVPLRIGSGTRLKILEALSMKKAVVTTSIGCEGINVQDNKHLLIRDNPQDFAQAVIELLRNEDLRLRLGENGRKLVEEKYDWNIVFKDLDKILTIIVKR